MLGSSNNNLDLSTPPATLPTIAPTPTGSVYTIHGRPHSLNNTYTVTLQNAGNAVSLEQMVVRPTNTEKRIIHIFRISSAIRQEFFRETMVKIFISLVILSLPI
ncbi:hypothetical protein ACFOEQ_21180 [Chryseobacterium arachidis]|uniref:hypothetical protein n=1 Tax=Chryseobacterium arachidis TaxID=1416778 RepID=UPI00360D51FA